MLSRLWRRVSLALQRLGLRPVHVAPTAGLLLVGLAVLRRLSRHAPPSPKAIPLSLALQLMQAECVKELIYTDGGVMLLQLKPGEKFTRCATMLVPGSEATIFQLASSKVPSFRSVPASRSAQIVVFLVPAFFFVCWYLAVKSLMSSQEKNGMPKNTQRKRESTTFADVVCKSKVELAEIVDCLNNPEKYQEAGARLPRGALLVGPSGTGKTLLARAVAGEAKCRFLSASASEFVEVYVGRGAARVRDLFRQAREWSPVVLFIDELDAVGNRSRSSEGKVSAGEEYIQTLNQLLTELDGFHCQPGKVVVLAATNRYEAIDPALLRPGRFDRHVFIELPDEEERLAILSMHARRAPSAAEIDVAVLRSVAANSQGLSGAELVNLVNEAVFLALRVGRERCNTEDFARALERAKAPRQRSLSAFPHPGAVSGLLRALR